MAIATIDLPTVSLYGGASELTVFTGAGQNNASRSIGLTGKFLV